MSYPAFYKWLRLEVGSDPEYVAAYLKYMLSKIPSSDSEFWKLLEETGDKTYTHETFIKAATIAISRGDS